MNTSLFNSVRIPVWKICFVLIGFPILSTILSLLLINKSMITNLGLDFFTTFWTLIIAWYLGQIWIISKILKSSSFTFKNIGYSLSKKKTTYFILGYLMLAFSIFAFVEFALASANISNEQLAKLSDFSNITPKTTQQRIIFIFGGLVAGISEEFVYRGFAINAIESYGLNKWIAAVLATIPFVFQHGLKSIDQFSWFFISGLVLSIIYLLTKKKLYVVILIHWLVILSAILAILQVPE